MPVGEFPVRPLRQARSEYFSLKVSKNKFGHNRFAVVIGARVEKRSVRRHFWKRRILDWAKREPDAGADLLITVAPPLNKLSKEDAAKEFKKVFETAMRVLL